MILDRPTTRFILIAFAGGSLLIGLWAGALRLGWGLPVLFQGLPLAHGPLMVVGFLGTLIGLERAVALDRFWPYAVPLFAGLSAVSFVTGSPVELSALLAVAGSFFLILVFIFLYRQSPAAHFVVMAVSAVAWLIGNALWLGGVLLFSITPWWIGFLVLMIAGERLQLSRVMQRSHEIFLMFHLSTAMTLLGLLLSLFWFHAGIRISGAGLMAVALWLLWYDIAWRTIHEHGLSRYMAVCLLSGYFWLLVGGLLWLFYAQQFSAGPKYDAMLHAIFLGFVFSMIFAHAPVIFPAITGIALPFRSIFYLHLVLLHASLLLRIAGDLTLWVPGQKWGGLLNILTLLLFLIANLRSAILAQKNR